MDTIQKTILLIEDDASLSQGIRLSLQSATTKVTICPSLKEARLFLNDKHFDLLILDINLGDGNGLDLLIEIRKNSRIPVILLTANDLETDIVTGLELGADDYITKPFSLAVLRARVNTQIRRTSIAGEGIYQIKDLFFNFNLMEFYKQQQKIELSKTEQKLLRLLVNNPGITLSRTNLIDQIWTDGAEYVDENALSVAIKRLRNKLEDQPSKPKYLCTVYGIGYVWKVE
ncbi:response regulator transcription factor [Eubacteriaceae bacterium ES2]|nr:response regulator transcription factor [Eubacteriaceae bacterium ES2]